MTAVAGWNFQAGRGVDGRVHPMRIGRTIHALALLRETAFPGRHDPGSAGSSRSPFAEPEHSRVRTG